MLREELAPYCERIEIAGSIRRRKPLVHDIEILFIPKMVKIKLGLFDEEESSAADAKLATMLLNGGLDKRPNKLGHFTWGSQNKLGIHVNSGIPVDFFTTNADRWWNSLVCRTGGKFNNLLITTTAQNRGWSFEAYGSGFRKIGYGDHHQTTSERDVFEFIGLPYKDPSERS